MRLITARAGKTTAAMSASSGWAMNSTTIVTTTSTRTLTAKARGLSTIVAVLTSESAWASSSPGARSRWKSMGRSR